VPDVEKYRGRVMKRVPTVPVGAARPGVSVMGESATNIIEVPSNDWKTLPRENVPDELQD
jgi:hypothetical protein